MTLRLFVLLAVLAAGVVGLYIADSREAADAVATAANNVVQPTPLVDSATLRDERAVAAVRSEADANESPYDCLRSGSEYRADDIQIVTREISGFEYPEIAHPRSWQARKFNSEVLKIARRNLRDFPDSESNGYYVSFGTRDFVSSTLYVEVCGASCHVGNTHVNFDLKTGKQIEKLAELFKPRSDHLKLIAAYCLTEFRRCEWSVDDEWFQGGTKPTADNYSEWSLTGDGVDIHFPEYQIGPGVIPDVTVGVPYSHLKDIMRKDLVWISRSRD